MTSQPVHATTPEAEDQEKSPVSTGLPANEPLTLAEIQEQEERLQFSQFTSDDAWILGTALVAEAREHGVALAVDITRGGQKLFHVCLEGTTPDNDYWLARKGRVVMRFGHSSLYMGEQCRSQSTTLEKKYGLSVADFAAVGGGFPIRVRGAGVVGFIAVSGLSQFQDHRLLVRVIEEFQRSM